MDLGVLRRKRPLHFVLSCARTDLKVVRVSECRPAVTGLGSPTCPERLGTSRPTLTA